MLAGCLEPGENATDEPLSDYLDERVPELLDYYNVPGACIALVRNGEMTWTGAYGDADRENGQEMTANAVFRAASITKSITAWGVMHLVERGEIERDDPIEDHVTRWELPEASFDTEEVTVQRLLSHTSGLQIGSADDDERYTPEEDVPAPEDVLSGAWRGSAAPFERAPGSGFNYLNAGYALLELLIEEVTGRNYEAYMEAEILNPLGMDDTTFSWDEGVESAMVTDYLLDGIADRYSSIRSRLSADCT